jgi:hypothetical protein
VAKWVDAARKQATAEFWQIQQRLRHAYRDGRLRQCKNLRIAVELPTRKVPPPRKIEASIDEFMDILEKLSIADDEIQAWAFIQDETRWNNPPFFR